MRFDRIIGGLAAGALATGLAAAPAAADTLRIGAATAQTGGLAPFDGPVMEGIRLAVDEINAAGGIGGRTTIELIAKDVRSDIAQTAIAVQELVDAGVSVLVTPCDADPSLAAAAVAEGARIPAFSTCASSPTLTAATGDFMFANYPGDNMQATVSARYALERGYRNAYILVSPDSQYTMLPLYFADVFEKGGGTVVGQGTFTMGQQDFSAEVTRIANLQPRPDVVMTAAYEPDFPAFLRQLRGAGIDAAVIGSDGIDTPTVAGLGAVADGVVYTTAGMPVEGSPLAAFNEKYRAKYGRESETTYNAIGYDLIAVIAAAVEAAGSIEPEALRDAIAGLENVQGATGTITYKGTDGMPVRQVALVELQGGERRLLDQMVPDPADVPPPRL